VVYNDYMLTSALARLRQLAEPSRLNDTLCLLLGDILLLDP